MLHLPLICRQVALRIYVVVQLPPCLVLMTCAYFVLPQLSQGYMVDRSKARATEEANSRLERQSRELEAQAKLRHMCERAELDRCRLQMSEFVGPVRTAVVSYLSC
jgi:hypothetical protein